MKKSILLFVFIYFVAIIAFSQTGSITNVQVAQRSDGSGLVDINFDLEGSENSYYINMKVSYDAGLNYFALNKAALSGITEPITPGNNKHVVWNAPLDNPNRYSPLTKIMVIAYNIHESINPCPGASTVTDYEGNIYGTVQIGDQCWMMENLKATKSADGNNISRICYGNDIGNCELYGGLYTWATIMNGSASSNGNPSEVQGICPNGWHVPSDAEWSELTEYLLNTYIDVTTTNVGNKLKSCRQVGSPLGGDCNTAAHPRWDVNSNYGTDDFGFSALPGGSYSYTGYTYNYLGSRGNWWSSTETSSGAWLRIMISNSGEVYRYNYSQSLGFYVRCVRD